MFTKVSCVIFLDYRARFYGMGVDLNDGSRLVFFANRRHYRLIRVADPQSP